MFLFSVPSSPLVILLLLFIINIITTIVTVFVILTSYFQGKACLLQRVTDSIIQNFTLYSNSAKCWRSRDRVKFLALASFPPKNLQTFSGTHTANHSASPQGEVAESRSWPLMFVYCRYSKRLERHLHLHLHMSSWLSATTSGLIRSFMSINWHRTYGCQSVVEYFLTNEKLSL
jgi:hypothetical protein